MQFFKYTVLRLVLFFVIFLPLAFFTTWDLLLIGALALVIAFSVSYLFFNKLRLAANADVQKMFASDGPRKSKKMVSDEEAEDRFIDGEK